jgi:hypothetical protein
MVLFNLFDMPSEAFAMPWPHLLRLLSIFEETLSFLE